MEVSTRTTVYEGFGWHIYRDGLDDGESLWVEFRSTGHISATLEARVPDDLARIIERGLRAPLPGLVEPRR